MFDFNLDTTRSQFTGTDNFQKSQYIFHTSKNVSNLYSNSFQMFYVFFFSNFFVRRFYYFYVAKKEIYDDD